jgi:hypothetical protein
MSGIPLELVAEVRKGMEAQRQVIMKYLKELKDEGFTNTMYDAPHIRWDDMTRYSVDGVLSCWGPDIADTSSHYETEGSFAVMDKDQKATTITDVALAQCLKRIQSTNATTCLVARKDQKEHYAHNTKDGVRITTHEGLEVSVERKESWVCKGVSVTSQAADNIQACIADKLAQRFSHDGRDVWAIPDGNGSAKLFNYTKQGDTDDARKLSVPLLKEVATGKVRNDLEACFTGAALNQVSKMSVSEVFMLDKKTTTVSTVVAHSSTQFVILNYGGVGKHANVKYFPGFQLPLYTIRSPNLNERVSAVALDRTKVLEGQKMCTLYDVAKSAGSIAGKFGLSDAADLSADTDKSSVNSIRFQATIVPGSHAGKPTEVYEKIYNYQTHDEMRPTALYSYHTSFGSSFTSAGATAIKIQPCTYNGSKLSAFNLRVEASKKLVGDDATYTQADNQENIDAGFGMAVPIGPFGFPKVANATMLVQWPVSASSVPEATRSAEPMMFDEGGNSDDDDKPCYRRAGGPKFRSLSSGSGCAKGMKFRSLSASAPATGELYASRMGLGSYQGEARGIKNPDLARRTNAKPTITYNRFYSLEPPTEAADRDLPPGMYTVSKDQVKKIVKMLDELYEIAGKAHHLADPEAVSVEKISASEFNKAPLGPQGPAMPMDVSDDAERESAKRPRIELEEVKRPRMVMIEC